MKFGLIWKALIRSRHVLTLWIINTLGARNQYKHAYAHTHTHTHTRTHNQTTFVHNICKHTHTNTDGKTIGQREDGQNPRAQGGFLMMLLDFVSPTFFPSPSIFTFPLFCLARREVYSDRHCRLYSTVVGWDSSRRGGLVANPQCFS